MNRKLIVAALELTDEVVQRGRRVTPRAVRQLLRACGVIPTKNAFRDGRTLSALLREGDAAERGDPPTWID